ncbi:hypothetical protein TNCV_1290391 [Trichonephila clavipes]|nr:hypothetical protein TNCV_1290391 [Trichonephila clavipes]
MVVMNRAATSRTIAKQIQSFTYHPVFTRTIRPPLRQNGISQSRPLLRLSLTGNHWRFPCQCSAIVFFLWFFKKRSVMSRKKQRSAFEQVSEFDIGTIVAYRDCGLSFRKIGSRVGRNQTTC